MDGASRYVVLATLERSAAASKNDTAAMHTLDTRPAKCTQGLLLCRHIAFHLMLGHSVQP